jgi:hypothetical protein
MEFGKESEMEVVQSWDSLSASLKGMYMYMYSKVFVLMCTNIFMNMESETEVVQSWDSLSASL